MKASPTDNLTQQRASAAVLSVEDLTVRYGEQVALRGITLSFPQQSITAVIGPSGCGKTTLFNSLNRLTDLVPQCRVSGTVRLGEIDIFSAATDVVRLRRRIGMIFQRPNPFPLSIRRNLELPLSEHGVRNKSRMNERIERTLQEVGLWEEVKDRLHRPALALSGGQQQRLCLARALALEPEVILLDEPCSALDPLSTGTVEDLLLRLRDRYTLVVVTHNLGQARRVSDCTALLWSEGAGGYLVEQGQTRQVFDAPREKLTASYVTGKVG